MARKCKTCGAVKPLTDFTKDWRCKEGRLPICKGCRQRKRCALRAAKPEAQERARIEAERKSDGPRDCATCGSRKPIGDFPRHGPSLGGRRIHCRDCMKATKGACSKCGEGFEGLYCRPCKNADNREKYWADPEASREKRRIAAAKLMADPEKRAARKRYLEEWLQRPGSREGLREAARRYEQSERGKSKIATYRKANAQRQRERNEIWRKQPGVAERLLALERARYWKDHDRALGRSRKWRERNLEKAREMDRLNAHTRRERIRANGGRGLDKEAWDFILIDWDHCCAYCGTDTEPLLIEHVVPVSKGGPHDPLNIVPACHPCNASKRDKVLPGTRERLAQGLPALEGMEEV